MSLTQAENIWTSSIARVHNDYVEFMGIGFSVSLVNQSLGSRSVLIDPCRFFRIQTPTRDARALLTSTSHRVPQRRRSYVDLWLHILLLRIYRHVRFDLGVGFDVSYLRRTVPLGSVTCSSEME